MSRKKSSPDRSRAAAPPTAVDKPLRIIGGHLRNRPIHYSGDPRTRPMKDRVREALFNLIGPQVEGRHVIDLFAGTGQIGIEALSRGAEEAIFIEHGGPALQTIKKNLELTQLASRATVTRADVFQFLAHTTPRPCEYIYIAPPQYQQLWSYTLRVLERRMAWLAEEGSVIVQIHPVEYEPLALEHLALHDQRKYGSVLLCFYTRSAAP